MLFSHLGRTLGLRRAFSADRSDLSRREGFLLILSVFGSASVAPRGSDGNSVTHRPKPDMLRNSSF